MNNTSTLNWDTVFAVPITSVNKAIKDMKSSPSSFSYSSEKSSISGNYSDWAITTGGDGGNIYMVIPITDLCGICSFGEFSCSSLKVIAEVKLEFIHSDEGDDYYDLVVKSSDGTSENPIISIKNIIPDEAFTGDAVEMVGEETVISVFSALIDACLTANLYEFAHVFATVNLNDYIDKYDQWAWCKPSFVDYAYSECENAKSNSMLGVLCMTGGRTATAAQLQQIDPFVIPEKSNAGYLVSPARLLLDLMLPAFPIYWKKAKIDDFELIEKASTDTGKYQYVLALKENKSIRLDDVQNNGISYTPYIKELSIDFDGTDLIFNSYTETDVGMGVTAWCRATHYYTIELSENQNGQTLIYKEIKPAETSNGTYSSTATKIEEALILLASVVITIILGLVTDGVGFFVGSVIIGCLTGIALAAPEMIDLVNSDTSPSIDLMINNLSNPIRWNASDVFRLDYAGINNGLQLGGDLLL